MYKIQLFVEQYFRHKPLMYQNQLFVEILEIFSQHVQ
jgi:hypothetical protein